MRRIAPLLVLAVFALLGAAAAFAVETPKLTAVPGPQPAPSAYAPDSGFEGEWRLVGVNKQEMKGHVGESIKIASDQDGYALTDPSGGKSKLAVKDGRLTQTYLLDLGDNADVPPEVHNQIAGIKVPINSSYALSDDGHFLIKSLDYMWLYWAKGSYRFDHYEVDPGAVKMTYERVAVAAAPAPSVKEGPQVMAAAQQPNAIPAPSARRIALVIGNGAYKDGPLKNPVNDARDVAAALKHMGFNVTVLTDATHQQMENAVREFGTKLRQGGVGLFYYAGHGIQVGGENFLIPVNAVIQSEGDVKFGSVNAGLVLAKMEDAGNGLNIIILDACRSNPFARSFRSAAEGLAKMDAPTGSLIAYATAPGSVAADGSGRNGVFTQHLLRNMKTPGLPISEVLMRVRQGVVQDTAKKQVPWEASSLIGQFYFAE